MTNYIKIMTKLLLFLLAANAGLSGCETDKEFPTPISTQTPAPVDTCITNTSPQNLIKNPGFECKCNGQPTLQHWYDDYGDLVGDTSTLLSQDTPPGGGSWSIKLQSYVQSFVKYAETYITGQSGTNIFELRLFMKPLYGFLLGGVEVMVLSQNQVSQEKFFYPDTTIWKSYAFTDTLTTQPSDTIVVRLFAASVGPAGETAWFDLVEFKKLPQ